MKREATAPRRWLPACPVARWIVLTTCDFSLIAWFFSVFFVVGPRLPLGNSIVQVTLDQGYLELTALLTLILTFLCFALWFASWILPHWGSRL